MDENREESDGARADDAQGGVGDVESAGETTAAATVGDAADIRPVGDGTLVEVEGDPKSGRGK